MDLAHQFAESAHLTEPQAAALSRMLGEWGLPERTKIRLIGESENATFLATAPDMRRFVFRLHRPGYNDVEEIASEHAWIEALRGEGTIETPKVLHRCNGGTIGRLVHRGIERPVAGFEFMSGQEPEIGGDLPSWFMRLGVLTAKLHRHSRAWKRPAAFRRKIWTFDTTLGPRPHWGDWRASLGLDDHGRHVLDRTVEAIEVRLLAYGAGEDRFGLIHADLRLANLLVDGERLGVIDFDDCGFGWFMYDFAAAVSFIEHEPVVDDLRHAWVAGYRAVAPLPAADEAMLPVFVMLRRILLTAWVASHPEADAAKACGISYTAGTVALAERFLSRAAQP